MWRGSGRPLPRQAGEARPVLSTEDARAVFTQLGHTHRVGDDHLDVQRFAQATSALAEVDDLNFSSLAEEPVLWTPRASAGADATSIAAAEPSAILRLELIIVTLPFYGRRSPAAGKCRDVNRNTAGSLAAFMHIDQ